MANDSYEVFSAIREGHRNAAEEVWFNAIPNLDPRQAFCRGFDAGYSHSAPLASHTGEAEPVRECGNSECGWKGTTNRMLGSIGPLCPDCGETTEAAATTAAPGEAAVPSIRDALAELVDLMQGVIDGNYEPDSFTLQPARAALSNPAPVAAPAPASEAVACECCDLPPEAHTPGHWCENQSFTVAVDHQHRDALMKLSQFAHTAAHMSERDMRNNLSSIADQLIALTGDSTDAPVQQAGAVPMARIEKLAADIQRAGGAERSLSLVSAFLRDCAHAALKGEQPVEPSGTERGEV
jgi:hypothetical protein